ncbi:SH3 domain-containing protein [Microbacterium sp. NIBRBAC000506063]|uniref:SH3 domain-containing protein n=1 Tax=Microbacterium sp. NIBRBAC000506063 TaxID=2734618 RepID=UPI001BB5BEED|nr:SH3 domain-containing protein [Microbacterium sp. NIBRBAC000506063]QTV79659.1 SH3 domain-containing protein [Microbacterium sp. NIBRBAC000506063]
MSAASAPARTAPSTGCSEPTVSLAQGTAVERVATWKEWTRVKVADGTRWVLTSQLKTAPTDVTVSGVNLRAGASTSTSIITLLPKGTRVSLMETRGSWQKVMASSRVGWVHKDYLSATAPKPPAPITQVTTGAVNLRSGASSSSSVITLLAKGASVTVTDSQGSWRKVTAGSRVGWVHSDYLGTSSSAPKPPRDRPR